jgi:hypothetical protein
MIGEDGISHSDVSTGSFVVVALMSEPAESDGVVEFSVGALGF